VILETPAECGIKMKDWLNLLHRGGAELDVPVFLVFTFRNFRVG